VILVDAGPLVAITKADDQHHAACVAEISRINQRLGTVWLVLTEAVHLLRAMPDGQDAILRKVAENSIIVLPLDSSDVPRIRELMRKYSDRPMDLADAALVRVAERENIRHFSRSTVTISRFTGCTKESVLLSSRRQITETPSRAARRSMPLSLPIQPPHSPAPAGRK
jgi:uncharacterized protein